MEKNLANRAEMPSEDEVVDGPAIAAKILSNMGSAQKSRIVRAIQQKDPKLALKIQEQLFSFEDIITLTPQSIQLLVKEVQHSDLVLSLKTASSDLRQCLLSNMSERRRQVVLEDFQTLPPVPITQVDEAQRRILSKVSALRTAGAIRTQDNSDTWV